MDKTSKKAPLEKESSGCFVFFLCCAAGKQPHPGSFLSYLDIFDRLTLNLMRDGGSLVHLGPSSEQQKKKREKKP